MESRQGAIGRGWGWVEKVRNLVFGRNLKLFKCILFENQFSHSLKKGGKQGDVYQNIAKSSEHPSKS
jgi:hypothetical protein